MNKLENIFNLSSNKYSGFFDETKFDNGLLKNLKCYIFLLTSDIEKIESFVSEIVKENKQKLKGNKLHFSVQLKDQQGDFIKRILTEINQFKIVCFYGFIDENSEKTSQENKAIKRFNRINQFGYDFTNFYQLGNRELEFKFFYDKGYLDNKEFIKSKVLVFKENTENQKSYELIPNSTKYRERINEAIKNKKSIIILEFSKTDPKNSGLQIADYLLGAFRQLLNGNNEYYQIVKDKFYNKGCNFSLRGKSIFL